MAGHDTNKTVWYFGYGSNIRSASMRKRQISPLQTKPVVVPSHILTFDIFGIPYAEPAFASISAYSEDELGLTKSKEYVQSPERVPAVHGIAYQLTTQDYRSLVLSEGAGVGYDEVEVEALPISPTRTQEKIMVRTLKAKYPFRPNRAPSARYMVCWDLIVRPWLW